MAIAGLQLITPSSVAGTGVSLTGPKVSFSAAQSLSVNGVFDSTYDNYLIVIGTDCSAQSGWSMRLRASGSDATSGDYAKQYFYADGTGVAGGRTTATTSWSITAFSNVWNGLQIYVYAPGLAQASAFRSISAVSYNGAYIEDWVGTTNLTTAFDGFTIYTTIQNVTGSLHVYGLSQ